jgi:DnaJ-class molecular chaperone
MCGMPSSACPDCDVPGEGNCSRCHGRGKTVPDESFGRFHAEITCPLCKGNGACPTCGGTGEIDARGESG